MAYVIENLRMWQSGSWVKYQSKSSQFLLRLQYDQLLITTEDKVLESLNINGKLKGIVKDDILLLIISVTSQEVRKIKFKIRENLPKCLEELSARFPILTYGSAVTKTKIMAKYRKIEDVLKDVVEGKVIYFAVHLNEARKTPQEFKNFLKLSLIDPMFQHLLAETEEILKNEF